MSYILEFNFFVVNIRSLSKNLEYLEKDKVMLNHGTIFVTETWRDINNQQIPILGGYKSAFANKGNGKGVGIFFKKDAFIEKCEETMFQFIKYENENATIFCIYMSKGCNFRKIVDCLKSYGFDKNSCLVGDLNFDANKNNDLPLPQYNTAEFPPLFGNFSWKSGSGVVLSIDRFRKYFSLSSIEINLNLHCT